MSLALQSQSNTATLHCHESVPNLIRPNVASNTVAGKAQQQKPVVSKHGSRLERPVYIQHENLIPTSLVHSGLNSPGRYSGCQKSLQGIELAWQAPADDPTSKHKINHHPQQKAIPEVVAIQSQSHGTSLSAKPRNDSKATCEDNVPRPVVEHTQVLKEQYKEANTPLISNPDAKDVQTIYGSKFG